MEILLTGATGFVGSYVLEALLADGHSLCIVKRSFSKTERIGHLLGECKTYDLDRTAVERIYRENEIGCIVHCATYYGRNDKEYAENIESNLLFPLKLLSCGMEYGARNFVNTDSFFCNQINNTCLYPGKELYMGGYTLSKAQFRQWGQMAAAKDKINFINMKLEHVYGEKDNGSKFIPYVVEQCRSNVPALALGKGVQERDFVHVKDVADAYRIVINTLCAKPSRGYTEHNVGTGHAWTLREFVEIIHKALNSSTHLDWGARETGKGEIMSSKADNMSLRKLGWKPTVMEKAQIEQVFVDWGGVNNGTCRLPYRKAA